jgi:hypothetical protein
MNYSFYAADQGRFKSIDDEPHPDFRKRVKQGQVVMGELAMLTRERSVTNGNLSYSVPAESYTMHIWGDLACQVINRVPFTSVLQNDVPNMEQASLIKAYAKIKKESIMTGELIAGLGQTIAMLRSPMAQSQKLLKRMFQEPMVANARTARKASQAVSSAWLEYRYGMQPLVLDINQGIRSGLSFQARLGKRRSVVRSGVTGMENLYIPFTDVPVTWWFGGSSNKLWASGSVSTKRKHRVDAGVIFEVAKRTSSEQLSADLRLGSADLFATAWELVPFSFVADWFVDVGTWLDAVNLPHDVSVLGNWVTSVLEYEEVYASTDLKYTGWRAGEAYEHGSWGGSTQTVNSVNRRCNLTLPPLPLSSTGYRAGIHAVDAIALLLKPILGLVKSHGRRR